VSVLVSSLHDVRRFKNGTGMCLQTLITCPISISSVGSGKRGDLKKVKLNGGIVEWNLSKIGGAHYSVQ
jgi:hypothetical protein